MADYFLRTIKKAVDWVVPEETFKRVKQRDDTSKNRTERDLEKGNTKKLQERDEFKTFVINPDVLAHTTYIRYIKQSLDQASMDLFSADIDSIVAKNIQKMQIPGLSVIENYLKKMGFAIPDPNRIRVQPMFCDANGSIMVDISEVMFGKTLSVVLKFDQEDNIPEEIFLGDIIIRGFNSSKDIVLELSVTDDSHEGKQFGWRTWSMIQVLSLFYLVMSVANTR